MNNLVKAAPSPTALLTDTAANVAAGLLATALGAAGMAVCLDIGPAIMAIAVVIYVTAAFVVLARIDHHWPNATFGLANRITLTRLIMVALLAGFIGQTGGLSSNWPLVATAAGALLLDGFDGWVARRRRAASAFGARFDMEVDALLILVLSLLLVASGKVGAWVLVIGGVRYGFVAAGKAVPALAHALPPSRWRQAVCIVQVVVLVVCLSPPVTATTATMLAAGALALLLWSFGRDVHWLLTRNEPRSV